jgi:hypothetical protein
MPMGDHGDGRSLRRAALRAATMLSPTRRHNRVHDEHAGCIEAARTALINPR